MNGMLMLCGCGKWTVVVEWQEDSWSVGLSCGCGHKYLVAEDCNDEEMPEYQAKASDWCFEETGITPGECKIIV